MTVSKVKQARQKISKCFLGGVGGWVGGCQRCYKTCVPQVKTVIGGFYKEWSREGKDTIPDQVKRMDILTNQFDKATAISKNVIILGDANLCSRKWNNEKFKDKLKSNMEENGLICRYLGDTFTSDIVQSNGKIETSALDHIYIWNVESSALQKLPTEYLKNYNLQVMAVKLVELLKGSWLNFLP